jgi:long-chain acyl-CoA synthetase
LADSERRVDLEQAGAPVPAALRARTDAARAQLFEPWKRSAGLDRVRVAVVATAPNPGPLMRFYHAVGIPLGEAYGLSESAASGTAARPDAVRIGTVGTVSRHMELRIGDDGEILLRGPAVTPGYLNQPAATAEAIDEQGWLHTGDLGRLDADGYLTVVGRKKEIIVNSSGKNIAPVTVESAVISASPLIAQVCCIGDARPFAVALVVLDREYTTAWLREQCPGGTEGAGELAEHPGVVAEVGRAVAVANARLSRPEQVKRFRIVAGEWLPGRELTPTAKMRRREIARLYEDAIEELYA